MALPKEQGATRQVRYDDFVRRPGPRPPKANDNSGLKANNPNRNVDPRAFGRAIRTLIREGGKATRFTPYGRLLRVTDLLLDLLEIDFVDPRPVLPVGQVPTREEMVTFGWQPNAYWGVNPINDTVLTDYVKSYSSPALYFGSAGTVSVFDTYHVTNNGGHVIPEGDWSSVPVGDYVTALHQTTLHDGLHDYIDFWQVQRVAGAVDPYGARAGGSGIGPALAPVNPNRLRSAPSLPVVPDWARDPYREDEVVRSRAVEIGPNGVRRVATGRREPPRRRVKHNKSYSVAARIMTATFKTLDTVSEISEIVDSFYSALPPQIRRKVEKEWRDEQRFLDKAGQYGIDRADQKLAALYRYWGYVDPDVAARNLINNATEDFLLGNIHKRLPKNTVNALDREMKQVYDFIAEHILLG